MAIKTKNKAYGTAVKKESVLMRNLKEYKDNWPIFLMLVPGLIYFIVFHYIPLYGVTIAFKDFRLLDGILGSPWAGLKYFKMAFDSVDFWNSFRNTMIISLLKLAFTFPAPILLALLLNEVRCMKFKKVVQTISYLPHFLSWVVFAGIITSFLSPSTGVVNLVIKSLGFEPIYFVADNNWFRPILVITAVWKEIGWGTIVYLAALGGVDMQLYEAATIDGASKWKQTLHVTLPAITPTIVVMFIFAVGGIVNDDFDQIYNMYNPAVYKTGEVISTYVYKIGMEGMQYSLATAVGLFKNIIALVLIVGTNYLCKAFDENTLW